MPEESGPSPRPIEPVDVATAAFVGTAPAAGPAEPVEAASLAEYERAFGSAEGELGRALRLFFDNGGARAFAVGVDGPLTHGLEMLERVPFGLLALPDAGALDPDEAAGLARAAHAACERRRAFLLVDPPASLAPDDAASWMGQLAPAPNAAAWVPRLRLADGSEAAASGAVAGIIARTDRERGVWTAPAGAGGRVRGVADVTVPLGADSIDRLPAAGLNVIRRLPGGLVVWGARTATAPGSEWRFVNIRRLVLFLERSLEEGIRWVVFEPNGEALWSEVRRQVDGFMLGLFRHGAFPARTPEEAYFARCDRTTMTQDDIDNGRLVVVVGVAPLRPAEFVIFRIGQWTAANG